MRVLELFCGIGGCAAALAPRPGLRVVAAVDIHRGALDVYRHNFPGHPTAVHLLDTLPASTFRSWNADLWWLSPPCQPFTERGPRRDADDPRARPFLAVVDRIAEVRPTWIALENVPGFEGSRVHELLRETLRKSGYGAVHERVLCPSELGLPNRRRRFYLVASRDRLLPLDVPPVPRRPLQEFIDPGAEDGPWAAALPVDPDVLRRYAGAVHIVDTQVDENDDEALTNCFTSAYGRSHVRSGSYLRTASGVRRFTPAEVLRLLGFDASFTFPPGTTAASGWRLAGNSLSLPAVRTMLATVPMLK